MEFQPEHMASVLWTSLEAPSLESDDPLQPQTPPQKPPLPRTLRSSTAAHHQKFGFSQCHSPVNELYPTYDWISDEELDLRGQNVASDRYEKGQWDGRGLQDHVQCPSDSRIHGPISPGSSCHPLTQPGFYSPRIPRSKNCDAVSFASKRRSAFSPVNQRGRVSRGVYAHTLPLPQAKTALLKQSRQFSCAPRRIDMSSLEKPHLMNAVVSQTSPEADRLGRRSTCRFQPIQTQSAHIYGGQPQSRVEPCSLDALVQVPPRRNQPQRQLAQTKPRQTYIHRQSAQEHFYTPLPDQSKSSSAHPIQNCRNMFSQSKIRPSDSTQHSGNGTNKSQPSYNSMTPGSKASDTLHWVDCATNDSENKSSHKSQVDMNSKNVFGQPRVIASLRVVSSPRPPRKSTVVEDLKKLILMDDTADSLQGDSQTSESLWSCVHANSSPCTPLPSSPALTRHPLATTTRPSHLSQQSSPTDRLPMSEWEESELWHTEPQLDPGLMPLPDTALGLDWNSLVNAADVYEEQRTMSLLSEEISQNRRVRTDAVAASLLHRVRQIPSDCPSFSDGVNNDVSFDFPDQLYILESMLQRLSSDLRRERKDKMDLLDEVVNLRSNNRHLQEESLSANAQLLKFSQMFNIAPGELE